REVDVAIAPKDNVVGCVLTRWDQGIGDAAGARISSYEVVGELSSNDELVVIVDCHPIAGTIVDKNLRRVAGHHRENTTGGRVVREVQGAETSDPYRTLYKSEVGVLRCRDLLDRSHTRQRGTVALF